MTLKQVQQRQLDLGPAGWFRPEALSPAGNQIRVKAGFIYSAGCEVIPTADQLTVGFAGAGGQQRYDLVYIDVNGVVQTLAGTPVALASPAFEGAPGWTGTNPGPQLPDNIVPVAYVLVNEPAVVIVTQADITEIVGHLRAQRDLGGFFIDKGKFSTLGIGTPPTGASTNVTAGFTGLNAETPNGSATLPGVVTSPPLNLVHILDQNANELEETVTGDGNKIYGRLTFAVGVWTLSYYYLNAGVETAITAIETQTATVPTDIQLFGVPKVFCQNDPNRPLFYSPEARNSDLVAGDIPYATTAAPGKVQLEALNGVVAGRAVTGDDPRLAQATTVQLGTVLLETPSADVTATHVVVASDKRLIQGAQKNSGATQGPEVVLNFIEGTNVTLSVVDNPGNSRIDITINSTASGGFPGFGGTPPADTPGGSAGASGTASRSDHQHPLSSDYALHVTGQTNATSTSFGTTTNNPRIACGVSNDGTNICPIGVAYTAGNGNTPNQASSQGTGAFASGVFFSTTNRTASFGAWNSGSQTLTSSGGNYTVTYFVLGQTSL